MTGVESLTARLARRAVTGDCAASEALSPWPRMPTGTISLLFLKPDFSRGPIDPFPAARAMSEARRRESGLSRAAAGESGKWALRREGRRGGQRVRASGGGGQQESGPVSCQVKAFRAVKAPWNPGAGRAQEPPQGVKEHPLRVKEHPFPALRVKEHPLRVKAHPLRVNEHPLPTPLRIDRGRRTRMQRWQSAGEGPPPCSALLARDIGHARGIGGRRPARGAYLRQMCPPASVMRDVWGVGGSATDGFASDLLYGILHLRLSESLGQPEMLYGIQHLRLSELLYSILHLRLSEYGIHLSLFARYERCGVHSGNKLQGKRRPEGGAEPLGPAGTGRSESSRLTSSRT